MRYDGMTMLEIMRRWPETVPAILAHGMRCVGCPVAGLQTLEDAAREHGLDLDALAAALDAAISARRARRPAASAREGRARGASGARPR